MHITEVGKKAGRMFDALTFCNILLVAFRLQNIKYFSITKGLTLRFKC